MQLYFNPSWVACEGEGKLKRFNMGEAWQE